MHRPGSWRQPYETRRGRWRASMLAVLLLLAISECSKLLGSTCMGAMTANSHYEPSTLKAENCCQHMLAYLTSPAAEKRLATLLRLKSGTT